MSATLDPQQSQGGPSFDAASLNRRFPTGALDERPPAAPVHDGFSWQSGHGEMDTDLYKQFCSMNDDDGSDDNTWRASWEQRISAQHSGYLQIYMGRTDGWARKYVVLRGSNLLYFASDHKSVLMAGSEPSTPQGGFQLPSSVVLTQTR